MLLFQGHFNVKDMIKGAHDMDLKDITLQSRQAVSEILEGARLNPGDIFVIGCSSSEILGNQIGTATNLESANAVYDGIMPLLNEKGTLMLLLDIYLILILLFYVLQKR